MGKKRINAEGRRLDIVAEEAVNQFLDGHEVIVRFQRNADLDRVTSMINLCMGNFGMDLEIRHMDLRECILEGLGSSVKETIPIGTAASVILGLVTGGAATWPVLLRAASTGALLGLVMGVGLTAVHSLVVYKYRGDTCMKLMQSND